MKTHLRLLLLSTVVIALLFRDGALGQGPGAGSAGPAPRGAAGGSGAPVPGAAGIGGRLPAAGPPPVNAPGPALNSGGTVMDPTGGAGFGAAGRGGGAVGGGDTMPSGTVPGAAGVNEQLPAEVPVPSGPPPANPAGQVVPGGFSGEVNNPAGRVLQGGGGAPANPAAP